MDSFSRRTAGALAILVAWTAPLAVCRADADDAPAVRTHMEAARRLAGEDFKGALAVCGGDLSKTKPPPDPLPPTRVFDDLYFFGTGFVGAWALDTPDGIILFDALENAAAADRYIVKGMPAVGLDPKRIKYIVVTHGHIDHYGGARFLQDRFGARVLMSRIDWDQVDAVRGNLDVIDPTLKPGSEAARISAIMAAPLKEPSTGHFAAPPRRDIEIEDGQTLMLGGRTVTFRLTPGHTRGTVSILIPVTDRKAPHVAADWGGSAPFPDPALLRAMRASVVRFKALGDAAGADVVINSHPFMDGSAVKLPLVRARRAGDPNPYVVGTAGFDRFMAVQDECIQAVAARLKAAP